MLEVGAGNGYFTETFRDAFEITVCDFSERMLRLHPARAKIAADANHLPFADASFDVTFSGNLLHHLESPLVAVAEFARVARHHVVLIEPNALNPLMYAFGLIRPEERGSLKFTAKYLKRLGHDVGLRLRSFATQGAVLPNKAPTFALPLLNRIDGCWRLGFYHVAVFDVP